MAQDDILLEAEEAMDKAMQHLTHELKGLRTGRASPALVEGIMVEYYGTPTQLKSIAMISIPEATQILIKPFEKNMVRAVEKAISESKVGISPKSDGTSLRLQLPPMSGERRVKMTGQAKEMGETAKIAIRNARRDANKSAENDKEMTEDEIKSAKESIQELLKTYEAKVDAAIAAKNKEIMEV